MLAKKILRFGAAPDRGDASESPPRRPALIEPDWLRRAAAREASPATLSPSRAAASLRHDDEPGRARRAIGVLAHALLQRLPDVAPEARRAFAERFVAAHGVTLAEAQRGAIVDASLAALALPALAPLFGETSRAEVAIAGAISRDGKTALPFSGRIDRLAIAPDAVYVADFKSGARPRGGNPPAYVAQLALYRAALEPLYPSRPVRAFLVWLTGAEAIEIAAAELDAALANLSAS